MSTDNIISLKFDDFDFSNSHILQKTYVDMRIQQRKGAKCITIIEGLTDDTDVLKKMLKHFKKTLSTNGILVDDPELKWVMQLQGDQRRAVQDFLVINKFYEFEQIRVHGF
jgi:translation initiation factor 1